VRWSDLRHDTDGKTGDGHHALELAIVGAGPETPEPRTFHRGQASRPLDVSPTKRWAKIREIPAAEAR
jgi:hypothetical protein